MKELEVDPTTPQAQIAILRRKRNLEYVTYLKMLNDVSLPGQLQSAVDQSWQQQQQMRGRAVIPSLLFRMMLICTVGVIVTAVWNLSQCSECSIVSKNSFYWCIDWALFIVS